MPPGVSSSFGEPARTAVTGVPSWSVTPASSAARRSARTSRPGWTVAHFGIEDAAARKTGEETRSRDFLRRERDGLVGASHPRGGRDRLLDGSILRRRGRHLEHPALAQPDVLAARLGPGADAGDDLLPRARELERPLFAEHREDRGEGAPVAVDEAAVAAARPVPADLRLEQRDAAARARARAARARSRARCSRRRRSRRPRSRPPQSAAPAADRPPARARPRATTTAAAARRTGGSQPCFSRRIWMSTLASARRDRRSRRSPCRSRSPAQVRRCAPRPRRRSGT